VNRVIGATQAITVAAVVPSSRSSERWISLVLL
jgi:hypothetical protein